MSARANILARIRTAHGRPGAEPGETELARIRAAMAMRPVGPRPDMPQAADPVLRFKAECDRVGTTHQEAAQRGDVPLELARYLEANELGREVAGWHELAGLDWAAAGIDFRGRPAIAADHAGITGCFCAIAETGTLVLLSSPAMPKVTALLPETHVAVVSRARIVDTMEEAFALVRREVGEPPRSMWLVSGPSRTADIEQTIVIGAHGPYRAHVILVP